MPFFLTAQVKVNADIAVLNDLKSINIFNSTVNQLFVKDSATGGFFFKYDGPLPADGGIVFQDKAGVKWKRFITDGKIKPEWFGASPLLEDNFEPFTKAINYIYKTYSESGGTMPPYANAVLALGGVRYNFKRTLVFNNHIKIEGQGAKYEPATMLYFPKNTVGLKFTPTPAKGGYAADVKNIMVLTEFVTNNYDSNAHGITIACLVNFENVVVNYATGDGIHIDACGDANAPNFGIADGSSFINCKVQNCNNGVFINGCDANQIIFQSLWAVANRRWGIYDNGFLGNHYYNPQCDFNGNRESLVTYGNPAKSYLAINTEDLVNKDQVPGAPNSQYWKEIEPRGGNPWNPNKRYYTGGPYAIVNPNAYSTVFGAYTEEGEAPAFLNNRTIAMGGDQGSGVVGGRYLLLIMMVCS
ncbi:MAG: hypothetical protein WDM90_08240 [Ferruginibacter sp.]